MADLWADATVSLTLVGSLLMGAAAGWAALSVARLVTADRRGGDALEQERRAALRQASAQYRWFEPLVDELAPVVARRSPATVAKLTRALPLVTPLPWTAAEFLAVKVVEGLVGFFAGAALGYVLLGAVAAPVAGLVTAFVTPRVVVNGILKKAAVYRVRVRNRLPFLIDMVSLMVLSGATLRSCLRTAVTENAGHPLGDELARAWTLMDTGKSQAEALMAVAERLNEADVTEVMTVLVAADTKGGKELPALLNRMAEVLRTRRVQYLERESERAKVMITWPGLIVMVACLLIVAAVFVLPASGAK